MAERKVLGRGLGALIPTRDDATAGQDQVPSLSIDEIRPNPHQPRKEFRQEQMGELVASVREKGVIQPLLVHRAEGGYELIAGERRLRAARMAGLERVPVIIRDAAPTELLEISLIENLQREDLNDIEQARAYQRLIQQFDYTQDEVASHIGKGRSDVTNHLRLLKLPEAIQRGLASKIITMGHAKALLSLPTPQEQKSTYQKVVERGLTVRQTENLAKAARKKKKRVIQRSVHIESLQDELQRRLGTRVRIAGAGKKGRIIIEYYSQDDLNRISETIIGPR